MEENLDNILGKVGTDGPDERSQEVADPKSFPTESLRQNVDFRWLEPITIIGVRKNQRVLVSKVFFMESGDIAGFEQSFEEWLHTGEADLTFPLRGFTGFGPVKELAQVYLHSLDSESVLTIMSRPDENESPTLTQDEEKDSTGDVAEAENLDGKS